MGSEYYEESGGCPPHPCWVINYDVDRALHNFRFLRNLSEHPVRIYVSTDCAAIVVSNMALENISEPHVMAWRRSFREIDESGLLRHNQLDSKAAHNSRQTGNTLQLPA